MREEPDVIPSLPPRLLPVDEHAEKQLRKRTLTNLYNERPTWLANLHAKLDAAVFAAYGWPTDINDEDILERLLTLNLAREPQIHGGKKSRVVFTDDGEKSVERADRN